MKNYTLGKYYPGNSLIHRADPRIKFLGIILMMITILIVREWQPLLICLAGVLLLYFLTQIPAKPVLQSIKPIIFIMTFAFLLNLFSGSGEPLVKFWLFQITRQGITNAIVMSVRLCLIVILTTLMLTLTTTPMHLADALEKMLSPLQRFRFPAHEIAMMTSIALRFVPVLLEEADKIMKAQSSRGAQYDTGGAIKKAKGFVSILVPLFISALRRADELAQAMEARCYRGGEGRTKLHSLKLVLSDYMLAVGILAFCSAVLISHYFIFA